MFPCCQNRILEVKDVNTIYYILKLKKINKNEQGLLQLKKEVLLLYKSLTIDIPKEKKNQNLSSYITNLIHHVETLKRKYDKGKAMEIPNQNQEYIDIAKSVNHPQSKFMKETIEFERCMFNYHHKHCIICHQRRINIRINEDSICSRCQQQKGNYTFGHENKALPTYIVDNKMFYNIPHELRHLTIAEKLLIQRVSPLIPVVHIKNGSLGSRGHIVSFFQDIGEICNELPRLPKDVSLVKVIRSGTTKTGDNISNAFTINKNRVLKALKWLKKHNPLYNDITIKESNLSWMKNRTSCKLKDTITIKSNDDEDNDR